MGRPDLSGANRWTEGVDCARKVDHLIQCDIDSRIGIFNFWRQVIGKFESKTDNF